MSATEQPEVAPSAPAPEVPAAESPPPTPSARDRVRAARERERWMLIPLALVALVALVVLPLAAIVAQLAQPPPAPITPTPPPTATPVPPAVFEEDVFSFQYPADWWVMGAAEARVARLARGEETTPAEGSYVGGVFHEGMDHCASCAQIVASVARDAGFGGALSEAQYAALHTASQAMLGARLLSQRRLEVSSLPAVESIYLDAGAQAKVWELLIVPPQAGLVYRLSCSSHPDAWDAFEPVFRQAIATLRIAAQPLAGGPTRVPPRTPTPVVVPTPTPVRTYTVQAGDVLGQIAKNFGLTIEALAAANGLEDPYIIHPGDVLTIPQRTP